LDRIIQRQNWRGLGTTEYRTWNIRSITGKEKELVEEMKKTKVTILAVTETMKKGQGIEWLDDGFVLIHSAVPKGERARAGVARVVHKEMKAKLKSWNFMSKRILTVQIQESEANPLTAVAVYGPNEDETAKQKEYIL
jgi:predicted RNA-binding protein with TRAM domain